MTDHFDELPGNARIWIYQANQKMNDQEISKIQEESAAFVKDWTAHGKDLMAGARILHGQFLVLGVNEHVNGASGCSIDASVHFIQSLEDKYGIQLLNRSTVACINGDRKISIIPLQEVKGKIETGEINEDTLIFNNLVDTKSGLKDQWIVPAGKSWMKKYFNRKEAR